MSRSEPDATRVVRLWLEEGVTALPDRVLDVVLDQLPAIPQRRPAWPTRRLPVMNNTVRLVLAAAAAVFVALVGYQLLVAPNVGEPTPTQTPAPAPAAGLHSGKLDPGTYSIGPYFPVPFDLTIADTWETWNANEKIVRIWKPCEPGTCGGYSDILTFEIVAGVFSDPCHGVPGPSIGPGVDELVTALTGLPGFEAGPVTDVAVDGYPGKSFELRFVGPVDPGCGPTPTVQWTSDGRVDWGEGADQRVTVLDVDGTRLVVDAVTYASDGREMEEIIESINFE